MDRIHERYGELRFKDRAIDEGLANPDAFVANPNAKPGDIDYKSHTKLSDLYPDIAKYRTVSTDCFFSKAAMDLEWSRLWTHTWLFAGFECDARAPGDWFVYNIGRESFIIVRGRDLKIRAFHNVCRHRGNRLVRDEAGSGQAAFTCGFHSWCWDTMGRNVRVTDRQTFTDEALAGDLSLAQVAAEEVGPFIFINMDRSPVPIQDYLKGILPTLQSYDIGGMQLVKDVKIPVEANWKIAMNAFQETYHTHAQHPQVMLSTDEFHVQYDFYPSGHSRMITPQGLVSPRQNFREQMNDDIGAMLSAAGVDPADVQNAHDARPAMQRRKRSLGATGGVDYSRFTDTQLTDIYSGQIFPNTTFSAQPEGLLWTRYMPHATDPEKCIMHVLILARGKMPPRMAGLNGTGEPTSRVPRETVVAGSTGTYEVLEQDLDAIPLVQLGVRSASLPFIRFSEQEGRLQHFYAEIDSYLKRGEEADSATHHGAVP